MSGSQVVALFWLAVSIAFLIGLCAYLFAGPGSSRWYR